MKRIGNFRVVWLALLMLGLAIFLPLVLAQSELSGVAGTAVPLAISQPTLIADINAVPQGSSPAGYFKLDSQIYFSANDAHGRELWVTDGTANGTHLVKDIAPGPSSSDAYVVQSLNGQLVLLAWDEAHGRELWLSDGTDSGTILLKDINSGPASSFVSRGALFNNKLIFQASDGVHGRELWISDGTVSGTVLLADINPGPADSSPDLFVEMGGHGAELWSTDGTQAGTRLVKDIVNGPGSARPEWLTAVNDRLYFSADDSAHNTELWLSDGTEAGTTLLANLTPIPYESFSPSEIVVVNGRAFVDGEHPVYGEELWAVDYGIMYKLYLPTIVK